MGAHPQGRVPLDASTLAIVFEALRQPLPELSRPAYSQDQLLSELVESTDAIQITPVHKRRVRYTLGECMAELSDLEVDGRPIRTLALESIDPAAVVAQVAALGLQDRVNTSVPRGAAHLGGTALARHRAGEHAARGASVGADPHPAAAG